MILCITARNFLPTIGDVSQHISNRVGYFISIMPLWEYILIQVWRESIDCICKSNREEKKEKGNCWDISMSREIYAAGPCADSDVHRCLRLRQVGVALSDQLPNTCKLFIFEPAKIHWHSTRHMRISRALELVLVNNAICFHTGCSLIYSRYCDFLCTKVNARVKCTILNKRRHTPIRSFPRVLFSFASTDT